MKNKEERKEFEELFGFGPSSYIPGRRSVVAVIRAVECKLQELHDEHDNALIMLDEAANQVANADTSKAAIESIKKLDSLDRSVDVALARYERAKSLVVALGLTVNEDVGGHIKVTESTPTATLKEPPPVEREVLTDDFIFDEVDEEGKVVGSSTPSFLVAFSPRACYGTAGRIHFLMLIIWFIYKWVIYKNSWITLLSSNFMHVHEI